MKEVIQTDKAPSAIGPYSQGIKSGNTIYLSGQIAIDPATGEMVLDDIKSETHQVMKNIKAVLKAAGADLTNIVKTSIFLADMNDFANVNEVYASYFSENYPARETVQVSVLPKNVNVEISVIAILN